MNSPDGPTSFYSSSLEHRGFTLIELMIVVAIIAIIAAVVIPSLMESRISANEASAINSLRTLRTAAEMYSTRFGDYPPNLAAAVSAGILDDRFLTGQKSGYQIVYIRNATQFVCYANPIVHHQTGHRFFTIGIAGVIWENPTEPALPFRSKPLN